jgi:hypothetical protein
MTRFYLAAPSLTSPTVEPPAVVADVSPAYSPAWAYTGYGETYTVPRLKLVKEKNADTLPVSGGLSVPVTTTTDADQDILIAQFVSDPISEGEIAGTFKGQTMAAAANVGEIFTMQRVVKVVSGDGVTLRGYLLAPDEGPYYLRNQFHGGGWQNMKISAEVDLTPVTALNGDRIVVELGVRKHASGGGFGAAITGGYPDTPDLGEDVTGTDMHTPWVEFSHDFVGGEVITGDAAKLSTLKDSFTVLDTAKWDNPSGPASIVAGVATLGDSTVSGFLQSHDYYTFDWMVFEVKAAGRRMIATVDDAAGGDFAAFQITGPAVTPGDPEWKVIAQWKIGGAYDQFGDVDYDIEEHKWFKIEQRFANGDHMISWWTSPNGYEWVNYYNKVVDPLVEHFKYSWARFEGVLSTGIDNFNLPRLAPVDPDYDGTYPDSTLPDAIAPADDAGSNTVLDLIRRFSAATRQAVRLVNSTTIARVDVNAPLPAGIVQADAGAMYHAATQESLAGEKTLSLEESKLALTASAVITTNDPRIIESGWTIPQQLPVLDLRPAPVARISFTFTPHECTGEVEYAFPTPLSIVRRS